MQYIDDFSSFESDRKFYIFGSETSQDYDVMIDVPSIPPIEVAHNMCKAWNQKLTETLKGKEINSNLGVFKNGTLVQTFKGTVDELINCLYYTYDNHKQYFDNPISSPVIRDVDLKIIRVARFIITFYSRTELRSQIKAALRGDLKLKLSVLKKIDFTTMTEFIGKNEKTEDIYKVLAFQFGQVFSLIDGYEPDSYSKTGIMKNYPDLSNLLSRRSPTSSDLETLNRYLHRFIDLIESKIDTIKLVEV